MQSDERRAKILEILREQKSMRILELSRQLGVSRETVRKDLVEMEQEGLLKKTYGGAVLDRANAETDYERRRGENSEEKRRIARAALSYIEPGDTIYLDYGSTVYALAEELVSFKELTVVTNTIPVVNLLLHAPGIELIILGGNVRKNEDSIFGTFGLNAANGIYVDYGFFGCAGVDVHAGVTNYHMGEIELSKTMTEHSRATVLLADSSKFGRSALYKTTSLGDIDFLITTELPTDLRRECQELGVEIVETDRPAVERPAARPQPRPSAHIAGGAGGSDAAPSHLRAHPSARSTR